MGPSSGPDPMHQVTPARNMYLSQCDDFVYYGIQTEAALSKHSLPHTPTAHNSRLVVMTITS